VPGETPREAPPAHVDVSVLVPVLNEERYIERSVAAMQRQQLPGRAEFVFADGGSSDRTRQMLETLARQDPRIRIFDNPRRTVSSGLNVALRHARGRWVARMDAHTEYPDDYLATGVRRLQENGTRWVSGPQTPVGHGPVSRAVALGLRSPLGRGGSRKWAHTTAQATEYELDGGVFTGVWERSTLLEYGGWDERWALNEDTEMAARFLERGERLICIPRMAGAYVPRDSLIKLWRQYLNYGEYRLKTALAHPHAMRRSQLLPPAVVLDAALSVIGPRRLRSLARTAMVPYALVLVLAGRQSQPLARSRDEALLVPVVLAIMHFAHGLGTWRGVLRHGPPLAWLADVVGARGLARRLTPDRGPVFAPSLFGHDSA